MTYANSGTPSSSSALLSVAGGLLLLLVASSAAGVEIPQRAHERLAEWHLRHQLWGALHFALGAIAITTAIVVATNRLRTARARTIAGLAAAVSAALLTFVSPTSYSRSYHRAWQELDHSIGKFKGAPEDVEAINETIRRGEDIVTSAGPI